PLGALVWLCVFSKLTNKAKVEGEKEDEEDGVVVLQAQNAEKTQVKVKMTRPILITVLLLCLFAVATNFIKDGLTTWIPSILKEEYGLPASLSILLTLFLPVLGIFGNLFSNKLYRFFGDFIVVVGVLFLGSTALVGGVIASLSWRLAAITLIAFAFTYFLAGSSNSTITSVFPLQMKGKINSGLIAGIINGCCYIGSTISSYGLGAVADKWGWSTVFWLLFAVSALVVGIAAVYKMIQVCHRKQEK
ncbi:MAG: MFS transporter, partial [Clostridia bacterium]|nr:MFS transporter [Clostridia bacterium]